jgi:hypothetical protein
MAIMQLFAGGRRASRVDSHLIPKLLEIPPLSNRFRLPDGQGFDD